MWPPDDSVATGSTTSFCLLNKGFAETFLESSEIAFFLNNSVFFSISI
jgi:hypothetical protein